MIDIHSHILPDVDDGSSSKEESFAMLSAMKEQGVEIVAATPHFYASAMTPDEFLERRQAGFEKICDVIQDMQMDLRLGAEVLYFEGIHHFSALKDFCIADSDLLLLEMPFTRWNQRMVRDIVEINNESGLTVVLAHIDRYLRFQPDQTWEELADQGVRMQVNTEFFLHPMTRRKALQLLQNGFVDFIGSDCHNMKKRPPNLAAAMRIIEKHFGEDALFDLQMTEKEWFGTAEGLL